MIKNSLSTPPLVLHVIHHLHMGGMENGLINLINRMPATRYRHAIACVEDFSDFRSRLTRDDVEIYALHRARHGVWWLRYKLWQLCRAIRPTIVHSRNQSGLDAILPAWLARVPRRVHGEHGWDVADIGGTHLKPAFLRRLHRPFIDRYITVSKDLARYLVTRIDVPTSRIAQIYNGVDAQRFQPASAKPRAWLPEKFQSPRCVIIGSVGRAQPVKDHATLINAFAALMSNRPDLRQFARLVIVGDGPTLSALHAQVNALHIADITHLPGARDDIPNVLQSFDVFVLPSLNEGISNTILEAMACGLPVIATGVGGNVELVDTGVTGAFFRPGDVVSLTALLERYVTDEPSRHAHGTSAREIVLQRYSMHAMIKQYTLVYDDLLQNHRQ